MCKWFGLIVLFFGVNVFGGDGSIVFDNNQFVTLKGQRTTQIYNDKLYTGNDQGSCDVTFYERVDQKTGQPYVQICYNGFENGIFEAFSCDLKTKKTKNEILEMLSGSENVTWIETVKYWYSKGGFVIPQPSYPYREYGVFERANGIAAFTLTAINLHWIDEVELVQTCAIDEIIVH